MSYPFPCSKRHLPLPSLPLLPSICLFLSHSIPSPASYIHTNPKFLFHPLSRSLPHSPFVSRPSPKPSCRVIPRTNPLSLRWRHSLKRLHRLRLPGHLGFAKGLRRRLEVLATLEQDGPHDVGVGAHDRLVVVSMCLFKFPNAESSASHLSDIL